MILGCSSGRDSVENSKKSEVVVPFPHPEGWSKKENHGIFVITNGKSSCATEICHGADLGGGTSGFACNMCHETYPHSANWVSGGEHWQKALTYGKDVCAECHGEDFSGADTEVSCYSCHELYPHKTNWEGVTSHGIYTAVLGKGGCEKCHGSDYNGGNSGVSCYACHALYPHQSGWDASTGHGDYLETNSYNHSTCATTCHGTDLTGGYSSVSCYGCHSLYPHSPDWGSAPGFEHPHADYVEANSDSECINCHVDLKGDYQNSNPKCQYCH